MAAVAAHHGSLRDASAPRAMLTAPPISPPASRARSCCRRRRRPAARPACRSRTPTGRPCASPLSLRKPVSTSCGGPDGLAVRERHEDHLVAGARLAIPRAVLADEGAAGHLRRKQLAGVEGRARATPCARRARSRARSPSATRSGRCGSTRVVDVLAVVAVRPAVEARRPSPRSCSRARDRCRVRRAR